MVRRELDVVRAAASWLEMQSGKQIESGTPGPGNTEKSIAATNDDAVEKILINLLLSYMNAAELSEVVHIAQK